MNKDIAVVPGGRALSTGVIGHGRPVDDKRQHHAPRLDLPTLLRIIRDWRWLILGAVALGIAGGIIASLLTTPLYRSFVTLEVSPPVVEISDEQSRQREQGGDTFELIQTQIGLLNSRSLAERVAQELNLANRPEFAGDGANASSRLKAATARVAGGLEILAPEEGRLVRFSYTDDNPQVAAQVANGIADSFINQNLQRRFEASAYARRFLERQIAKTRGDLERSERQLVAYAQSEGIINLGGTTSADGRSEAGGSLQGESLQALNQALAEATARRVAAEGAYRSAQSAGPTSEVNASTQALRQARAVVEAEYQEKRTMMKPDHPEMVSLRSRIDELDRQIARETSQVTGGRTNTLAQEYRGALAAERALQSRVAALKGSVLDLRGRSVRYNILQREVDTNRGLYDALLQRYKEIGVAGGVGSSPVSIVDRAEVADGPFKPNVPLNLLAGLGIGLLGGVGVAVGLEFLGDTVKTREDVREKLQLACLGAIPRRTGKGNLLDDLQDPGSAISEAYSAVAAALRFSTGEGVPRSLVVTSTRPAEGKSWTASALAQNFARQGRTVLLLDGDLRKPSFKGARDDRGLTKLLTNHDDVAAHVSATQFENLWLLPCGPLPPNPADLLSTGRIAEILDEAMRQFEVVIVDAPPVLGLADSPLLGSAASGVLFVVESGKTRTREAIEALNRLEASDSHIVGAVLTKSTESDAGYGYYSYRYGALEDRRAEKIVLIPDQSDA